MWSQLMLIALISFSVNAELTNSCLSENCRWNLVREAEDSSKVTVDSSGDIINWKWDIRGGYWNVTYTYKYPSEWYSGKAVFVSNTVTSRGQNAFVSWGSSVPWRSNAIPIYARAWNLTYNGDLTGFIPTRNGRYYFRVFSRNKRHNPFGGKEPIDQTCAFSSNNPTEVSQWWQNQKASNACPNPILDWNWQGKNGYWTVQYSYIDSAKRTVCDVYYQGNGMSRMRVIKWELDETKQSVTYATNPFRIYEDGWQVSLRPSETWGFTPTGNGLWIFQHFSRNLVFQPFQAVRGTVTYNGRGTSGQNAPLYYAVGSPGQSAPVYTVGSSMSTPFYTAGTPIYQVGTQMTNPMYMYSAGSPGQSTPVYAVGSSVNTPFYTAGTPVYQIGTQMTNPTYTYTVGTPGQSTPVYTVGSSINTPFYSAGNPVYQFGTQITNPTYTYPVSQPVPGTQVYTVDSAPIQNPPK